MAGRWSEEENAAILANPEHGAEWRGWLKLLPGRSKSAIRQRRIALGVAAKRGRRKRPPELPEPSEPWSDEQRVALVRLATEMVDACGHDLRECLEELARVIDEHRKRKQDGTDA